MIAGVVAVAHAFGVALTPPVFEGCARAVSLLCGIALLAPLYWLGRRVLGQRGAQWALLFALFHPRLVQFSAAALSEMPFMLMILVGLAALTAAWRIEREQTPTALPTRLDVAELPRARLWSAASVSSRALTLEIAAGVAFGLGYLIRPEALLIAAALWVAGMAIRRGEGIRARLSPAFLISVLAVSAPFIMFLHGELGYWSLGEKGPYNFWREYRSEYATLYPVPQGLSERASESPELVVAIPPEPVGVTGFIIHKPGAFLWRYLRNLATIVVSTFPVAVYHLFFLLAIVGVIGVSGRLWWPVLVAIALFPFLYAAFSVDRRFYVPVIPLVVLISARGMSSIETWFTQRVRPQARASWISYGICAVLMLAGISYSLHHGSIDDAPEHRAAGEWLAAAWRAQAPADDSRPVHGRPIVMSRKPWVAFYANGLLAELPDGPVEEVLARVRSKQCDILVIDERWIAATRPQLIFLLDPAKAPAGLHVLYERSVPRRIILYDVRAMR